MPGGKIGTAWRFKRAEIAAWVDEKLGVNSSPEKVPEISIKSVLEPERIVLMNAGKKEEALSVLIDRLGQTEEIGDKREFAREINRREALMSTGIGLGVGIPHVRLPSIRNLVMAVGINKKEISDYDSMDNEPVKMIFMIGANAAQNRQYIKLFSLISAKVKDPSFRKSLLRARDPDVVYTSMAN